MNAKIIIGVGSSGMKILEQVQRYHYESFRKNRPDNVQYLFLETFRDAKIGITAEANEIKSVFLDTDQMHVMVESLKKNKDRKWLPPAKQIINAGMGAGGIRCVGRVSLWGRNSKQDNFDLVINSIRNAYHNVSAADKTAEKPTVFITGSLTGGTGSAVFIDLAYMVRDIIPDIKEVFGLFLLPPHPSSINGLEVRYANTYEALRDLELYNSTQYSYQEDWPNGFKKKFIMPPYEFTHFISQDYKDGSPAIKTLEGIYKIAGLFLFLNSIGMKEKRMERLVDASGNFVIGKYGMFGLSGVEFPKDQLQEYLATELGSDLIRKWTDSQNYIAPNMTKTPINSARILNNIEEKWDEIITEALNEVNNISGKDVLASLELDAMKIKNKEIEKTPQEYLFTLFSSNQMDKYYALLRGSTQLVINKIINDIEEHSKAILNTTENLFYVRNVLESFIKAIENTINYYKSIGINETPNSWENKLKELVPWVLSNNYSYLFESENVLADRLKSVFSLLKMHLLFNKLDEMKENIKSDKLPMKSTDKNKDLLQKPMLDQVITSLNLLISADNGNYEGKAEKQPMSFLRRQQDIKSDIYDDTIPIKRVYQSGNFESDLNNSKITFESRSGEFRTKDELAIDSLWEYLKSANESNLTSVIYERIIKGYRKKIAETDCVVGVDIANYITSNVTSSIEVARKSLADFLKLSHDKPYPHSPTLPRFIAGSKLAEIDKIINKFNESGFFEFQNSHDGKYEQVNLNNIIVFYNEDKLPSPLKDLSYSHEMKKCAENVPDSLSEDEMTLETWKLYRQAYNRTKNDKDTKEVKSEIDS